MIFSSNNKRPFYYQVYRTVKRIPFGKVATYGQIALRLRSGQAGKISPRVVGWALHALRHAQGKPKVPCHRVVNKDGRLAPNFAWDGAAEQHRRLQAEGIKFKDEMHVDLKAYLWQP